jgi:sugar phosphate isomerase/epimerase
MHRRAFLKGAAVGAGVVAGINGLSLTAAAQATSSENRAKAVLKLSSQESRLPGRTLKEKVENVAKYGGVGIELHSPKLVERIKEAQDAIAGTDVKISAICAADGPYIVPDAGQRKKAIENAKRLLTAAGELGSTGVIMVPAFNDAKNQLVGSEGRAMLIDILKELGEHAVNAKSRMMLEPLNRGEAWFLRQLADAASICRDVNSPGIAMMGDFYHMRIEETSDMGAFISAGKHLHHVHLASRKRVMPGQDERSFVDGFRGLKMIGYQDYCSLECGCEGKPEVEIPKAFAFLKQQWEEATV